MKCPHCNKQTDIPQAAFLNADRYGNVVKSITFCCNKLVYIKPIRQFEVSICFSSPGDEDDWGHEVK